MKSEHKDKKPSINSAEELAAYLAEGDDINALIGGITPLMYAIELYPEMIDVLLEQGASLKTKDENGNAAFNYACRRGSCATVKKIYEAHQSAREKKAALEDKNKY